MFWQYFIIVPVQTQYVINYFINYVINQVVGKQLAAAWNVYSLIVRIRNCYNRTDEEN